MFCITDTAREELKKYIESVGGFAGLDARNPQVRHNELSKIFGEETGFKINVEIEKKIASVKEEALQDWVEANIPDSGVKKSLDKRIARFSEKLAMVTKDDEGNIISISKKEQSMFLADMVKQKLGVGVTPEEAAKVAELVNAIKEADAKIVDGAGKLKPVTAKNKNDFIKAGIARKDFANYREQLSVNDLIGKRMTKEEKAIFEKDKKGFFEQFSEDFKRNGLLKSLGLSAESVKDFATEAGNIIRFSSLGGELGQIVRQGGSSAFTNVGSEKTGNASGLKILAKNTAQLFNQVLDSLPFSNRSEIEKVLDPQKKKHAIALAKDAMLVDIFSRPNSISGLYEKAGLGVGGVEEYFNSEIIKNHIMHGNWGKAEVIRKALAGYGTFSEDLYKSFVWKMRADEFDAYYPIFVAQAKNNYERAKKAGLDPKVVDENEIAKSTAAFVNTKTGKGKLGNHGKALGQILLAPSFYKSHLENFTNLFGTSLTEEVRVQSAKDMATFFAFLATAAMIASMLGLELEKDPRSSKFGQVKIGDSWVDLTLGQGKYVRLAFQTFGGEMKTSKGKIIDTHNPKYGQPDAFDIFVDFWALRAAPLVAMFRDYAKGEFVGGEKWSAKGQAYRTLPIPLQNTFTDIRDMMDSGDDEAWTVAVHSMLDILGVPAREEYKKRKD